MGEREGEVWGVQSAKARKHEVLAVLSSDSLPLAPSVMD